jgi:hypothetical protein
VEGQNKKCHPYSKIEKKLRGICHFSKAVHRAEWFSVMARTGDSTALSSSRFGSRSIVFPALAERSNEGRPIAKPGGCST